MSNCNISRISKLKHFAWNLIAGHLKVLGNLHNFHIFRATIYAQRESSHLWNVPEHSPDPRIMIIIIKIRFACFLTCLVTVASSNWFGILLGFDLMHRMKNGLAWEHEKVKLQIDDGKLVILPDSTSPLAQSASFGIVRWLSAAASASSRTFDYW